MAQHTAVTAAGFIDPISDAAVNPQASLLVRQILEAALKNTARSKRPPPWVPVAQAMLANVMMNDHLNWWNPDVTPQSTPNDVLARFDNIANPGSPFEFHVRGLVRRAQDNPTEAADDFAKATSEKTFARAHTQAGNQQALLGQPKNSHQHVQDARNINQHHPAFGYFDWAEGRACFEEAMQTNDPKDWAKAIELLDQSVTELSTVWFNRCYLAAAYDAAKHPVKAKKTVDDFIAKFDQRTFDRIRQLTPKPHDPPLVAAARKRVLDFVQPLLP